MYSSSSTWSDDDSSLDVFNETSGAKDVRGKMSRGGLPQPIFPVPPNQSLPAAREVDPPLSPPVSPVPLHLQSQSGVVPNTSPWALHDEVAGREARGDVNIDDRTEAESEEAFALHAGAKPPLVPIIKTPKAASTPHSISSSAGWNARDGGLTKRVTFSTQDQILDWDVEERRLKLDDDEFARIANLIIDKLDRADVQLSDFDYGVALLKKGCLIDALSSVCAEAYGRGNDQGPEMTAQLLRSFEEALKYRMNRLPMFPEPDESDVVSLTREAANKLKVQGTSEITDEHTNKATLSALHCASEDSPLPTCTGAWSGMEKEQPAHVGQHFFPPSQDDVVSNVECAPPLKNMEPGYSSSRSSFTKEDVSVAAFGARDQATDDISGTRGHEQTLSDAPARFGYRSLSENHFGQDRIRDLSSGRVPAPSAGDADAGKGIASRATASKQGETNKICKRPSQSVEPTVHTNEVAEAVNPLLSRTANKWTISSRMNEYSMPFSERENGGQTQLYSGDRESTKGSTHPPLRHEALIIEINKVETMLLTTTNETVRNSCQRRLQQLQHDLAILTGQKPVVGNETRDVEACGKGDGDEKTLERVRMSAPVHSPEGYKPSTQVGPDKLFSTKSENVANKAATKTAPLASLREPIRQKVGSVTRPPVLWRWKDGIFDCFRFGAFHSMLLKGLFCPLVALGQVMTRMKLTWLGRPDPTHQGRDTFISVATLTMVGVIVNVLLQNLPPNKWTGKATWLQITLTLLFNGFLVGYFLLVVSRTRAYVRRKYGIRERRCIGHEDVCVSVVCPCCVVMQMDRHTADYDTFRGTCCTANGMPKHVEITVPPSPVTMTEKPPSNTSLLL